MSFQMNNKILKDAFGRGSVLFRAILEVLMIAATVGFYLALNAVSADIIRVVNAVLSNGSTKIQENLLLTTMIPTIIATAIPLILTAVAYFIIYGKSRSTSPDARSDTGFIILNVFAILELIGAVIVAGTGISASVILLVKMPESMQKNKTLWTVMLIGAIVCLAVMLIIAIVYKLYIGSVRRTAKSNELSNRGAKAFGVFSILKSIWSFLGVLSAAGMLILHNRLIDMLRNALSENAYDAISNFVAGKGTLVFVLILMMSLTVFLTHIADAAIALGYNRCIKDAQYSGAGKADPPANDGFYSSDAQPKTEKKKKGYGDRFIED